MFASNLGEDTQNCGFSVSTPCRTLQHLTSFLRNTTRIYLLPEGPDQQQFVYDPGGNTLLGFNGTIVLDGKYGKGAFSFGQTSKLRPLV